VTTGTKGSGRFGTAGCGAAIVGHVRSTGHDDGAVVRVNAWVGGGGSTDSNGVDPECSWCKLPQRGDSSSAARPEQRSAHGRRSGGGGDPDAGVVERAGTGPGTLHSLIGVELTRRGCCQEPGPVLLCLHEPVTSHCIREEWRPITHPTVCCEGCESGCSAGTCNPHKRGRLSRVVSSSG
jgi:hypothetical protein